MNGKRHDDEKARHWEKIIQEAARSGLSILEFCRQRGLQKSQFYWWRRRLKARRLHYRCVPNFYLKPQIHRKMARISINRQGRMSDVYIIHSLSEVYEAAAWGNS